MTTGRINQVAFIFEVVYHVNTMIDHRFRKAKTWANKEPLGFHAHTRFHIHETKQHSMRHKINAFASKEWITKAASRFISHRIGDARRKENQFIKRYHLLGMQHKKPTVHSMLYKH